MRAFPVHSLEASLGLASHLERSLPLTLSPPLPHHLVLCEAHDLTHLLSCPGFLPSAISTILRTGDRGIFLKHSPLDTCSPEHLWGSIPCASTFMVLPRGKERPVFYWSPWLPSPFSLGTIDFVIHMCASELCHLRRQLGLLVLWIRLSSESESF